jgi:hypothetical protein
MRVQHSERVFMIKIKVVCMMLAKFAELLKRKVACTSWQK